MIFSDSKDLNRVPKTPAKKPCYQFNWVCAAHPE